MRSAKCIVIAGLLVGICVMWRQTATAVSVAVQGEPKEGRPYVILTNLPASDPYYRAVEVLAKFRGVEKIVSFEGAQVLLAREELRRLQPHYVALVLRPEAIDANFVARVFQLGTQMDDDPQVDFAYGLITGATPQDAVELVTNTIRSEREAAGLPRKFLGVAQTGGDINGLGQRPILLRAMQNYADCFQKDGWQTQVIERPADDPDWKQKNPQIAAQMAGCRLIFFAGHGGPTGTCGLFSSGLESSDLFPAIVLNGGCLTGVTFRCLLAQPGQPVSETKVGVAQSFALRLIKQGVVAHLTGLGVHGWMHLLPAVYPVYSAGQSLGEAQQAAYNSFIRETASVAVRPLRPGEKYPPVEEWNPYELVATCVLYGDPAYVPFPDASQRHRALPPNFNPWGAAPPSRE